MEFEDRYEKRVFSFLYKKKSIIRFRCFYQYKMNICGPQRISKKRGKVLHDSHQEMCSFKIGTSLRNTLY